MKGGERDHPFRFADVLPGILQGLGLGRVISHLAVLRAWDRIIPLRVRERTAVEGFREGRLYLCVEDSIWLHELHMLRHKLKTMLNEDAGKSVVEEIILRVGRTSRSSIPGTAPARVQRSPALLGGTEAVKQLLSPVENLPCRAPLERLLHRWMAMRK